MHIRRLLLCPVSQVYCRELASTISLRGKAISRTQFSLPMRRHARRDVTRASHQVGVGGVNGAQVIGLLCDTCECLSKRHADTRSYTSSVNNCSCSNYVGQVSV